MARQAEMLLAILSELCMLRERLDTVERLIEGHGLFPQAAIDAFAPDGEAQTRRDALRRRQIDKVMRPLREDTERAAARVRKQRPGGQETPE